MCGQRRNETFELWRMCRNTIGFAVLVSRMQPQPGTLFVTAAGAVFGAFYFLVGMLAFEKGIAICILKRIRYG